ncbi:MAG: tRNA dihydrouridine synthase DusB [Saprospiraceae bacterium]|nr:tRNA dihydrouridine synthase DusB [Saprospiraceae bacterium]
MIKIRDIQIAEFPLLLAPMEDVSDPPFRFLCKEQGADLMYTEFISVEGLIRDADKSLRKLDIYENERPIGIQVFGGEIESMVEAMGVVEVANPEIIDINFGCPVNRVVCKMAGAGILQDIPRMVKLTEAIVKATSKPVTVKTRLGWDENSINIIEVAERLQDVGIEALTVHGRTRKQMYKGEADWSLIAKIKENQRMHIPIFGNGDIDSPEKAKIYKDRYGIDGIMIGRASIGYPWIFREVKHYLLTGEILPPPTISERADAAKRHLMHAMNWKGSKLGVLETRRHYTNYFKGFPDIKPFRARLVTSDDPEEIFGIIEEIKDKYILEESILA